MALAGENVEEAARALQQITNSALTIICRSALRGNTTCDELNYHDVKGTSKEIEQCFMYQPSIVLQRSGVKS